MPYVYIGLGYFQIYFCLHRYLCKKPARAGWGTHIFCACGSFYKISHSNFLCCHFITFIAIPIVCHLHVGDPQTILEIIYNTADPQIARVIFTYVHLIPESSLVHAPNG